MKGVPTDIGTVHFVGIGGIGMSGIAEVLSNLGSATMRGLSGVEQKKPFGEPLMALASGKEVTQREHEAIYDAIRRGEVARRAEGHHQRDGDEGAQQIGGDIGGHSISIPYAMIKSINFHSAAMQRRLAARRVP